MKFKLKDKVMGLVTPYKNQGEIIEIDTISDFGYLVEFEDTKAWFTEDELVLIDSELTMEDFKDEVLHAFCKNGCHCSINKWGKIDQCHAGGCIMNRMERQELYPKEPEGPNVHQENIAQEIIEELNYFAQDYDRYEYGLPSNEHQIKEMKGIILRILNKQS